MRKCISIKIVRAVANYRLVLFQLNMTTSKQEVLVWLNTQKRWRNGAIWFESPSHTSPQHRHLAELLESCRPVRDVSCLWWVWAVGCPRVSSVSVAEGGPGNAGGGRPRRAGCCSWTGLVGSTCAGLRRSIEISSARPPMSTRNVFSPGASTEYSRRFTVDNFCWRTSQVFLGCGFKSKEYPR